MDQDLSLPEQIILLHLDDTSGKLGGTYVNANLIMAGIAELLLQEKVRVDGKHIAAAPGAASNDPALAAVLSFLAAQTDALSLEELPRRSKLAETLKTTTLSRLVERGILKPVEESFLWVWRRTLYPTVEISPEAELRRRIKAAATCTEEPTPRMRILFGILKGSGSLQFAMPIPMAQANCATIDNLCDSSPIAEVIEKTLAVIVEEDTLAAATAAMAAMGS